MIDSPRPSNETTTTTERSLLDRHVPEYQVVREIGRGGMGVVFLARDVMLHRLVAIKVLRHEFTALEEHRERFRREARVTARLNDEGVVEVHGFGERADLVYIVLEFVRGTLLSARLAREPRLSPVEVQSILCSLARTLEYTHSRGVVHRDLKPDNILLEHETGRPLLTDFGVALTRTLDPTRADYSHAFGTPQFMSPEQAAGETDLDGRSDIYSLGVLGYQMLAGTLPFDGDNFASIASQQVASAHTPLRTLAPHAPAGLVAAIEKCLKKEPRDRWRTAGELAHALTVTGNLPIAAGLVSRLGRMVGFFATGLGLSAG